MYSKQATDGRKVPVKKDYNDEEDFFLSCEVFIGSENEGDVRGKI